MKKVAVVCAAGKEGRLLVDEAVSRGYDVTGFVRGSDKVANPKAKTVVKDLFDLTREDLIGFDAVIDAFGAWTPETLPLHKTSLKHLFPSSGSNALARKAAAGENPAVFFPFRGGAGGGTINRAESGSRTFLPRRARFSL